MMEKALKILKACRERGQKRAGGLDLDEAISELEEAMKPKSCEGCKYGYIGRRRCTHTDMFFFDEYSICMDIDFCCNRYEPKEQQ